MPLAAGDIIRIVCRMSIGGNDIINTYHGRADSGSQQIDSLIWSDIADTMDDAYGNIAGYMANTMTFDDITVYNLTQDALIGQGPWPTLVTGTSAGAILPEQNCLLVRWTTDQLRSQGRKFLGVFTESDWDGQSGWSTNLKTAVGLYVVELLAGIVGSDFVVSLGNWNDALQRFSAWFDSIINNKARIQRRRTPGRGS